MKEIPVLDKGFVSLEAECADDVSVVNAARVSFNTHVDYLAPGDEKLIGYLMKHRHGTPFEHNLFRFRVKAPLFVFREWHRHRIGISINEWSARYSELKPDFYIPAIENVRTQTGKPGHYIYETIDKISASLFTAALKLHSEASFKLYQWAIKLGVAKEQARFFLPVNIYSEMYWSCNARSLMAFLSLRNAPTAMWEIQQYARVLEEIFLEEMPVTAKYFIDNGRIAP
jgi:thymidylate synthase (FAD)